MTSLVQGYRAIVCDLDGVVYRGPNAVPYAVDALNAATGGGVKVIYATNNASRPPGQVATHLGKLGIMLSASDVINSSIAGAKVLKDRLPAGATVLAVGGEGVGLALREAKLTPVREATAAVQGVLQGYGAWVAASDLAEVAYAVQAGALWVATNDDATLPTDRGTAPGNGSLVAAVRMAVDCDPEVVGKPGPLMYEMAMERVASDRRSTLAIGDRLETDIEGAHHAGIDSLHVLTGVHGPTDLVTAPPMHRPRYVAQDLRALQQEYIEPQEVAAHGGSGKAFGLGDISDTPDTLGTPDVIAQLQESANGVQDVRFSGDRQPSPIERLRLALRVLWSALDEGSMTPDEAVAAIQRAQ